jgi:hypothetical protein
MDESRARRVADALRELGLDAHLERPGVYAFGVAVQLPDGRRAVWGADGELSATVVRDGVLVGFVPALPPDLDEVQLTEAIARTDYDAPAGQRRERALPAGPPRPVRRGLFQRVMEGRS